MKKLISQNGSYKVYAEIQKIESISDQFVLKFISEWDDANQPEEQYKFAMFLNSEQLKVLKELL